MRKKKKILGAALPASPGGDRRRGSSSSCLLWLFVVPPARSRRDISVHCSQAERRDDGRAGQRGRCVCLSAERLRRADVQPQQRMLRGQNGGEQCSGKIDSVRASGKKPAEAKKKKKTLSGDLSEEKGDFVIVQLKKCVNSIIGVQHGS